MRSKLPKALVGLITDATSKVNCSRESVPPLCSQWDVIYLAYLFSHRFKPIALYKIIKYLNDIEKLEEIETFKASFVFVSGNLPKADVAYSLNVSSIVVVKDGPNASIKSIYP